MHEGLDGIEAAKRIDGDRVRSRHIFFASVAGGGISQVRGCVRRRRRSDIAPFHVTDCQQTQLGGFCDQAVVRLDPFPEISLEISGLKLHARHMRRDNLQQPGGKREDRVDRRLGVVAIASAESPAMASGSIS